MMNRTMRPGRSIRYQLILGLALMLLLTACTMGSGTKTYDKYKGTEGLTIRFLDKIPAETLPEDRAFPVKFEVQNKGAQNVSYDKMLITFSNDPLYITGGWSPYEPAKQDLTASGLWGRSEYYPQGEKKMFSVPTDRTFATKPIFGQRERPQTDLVASLCYAYRTYASAEVCIDTNIYQENERQQSCAEKDIPLSGGQGAPIAVTLIEVDSLPVISDSGTESVRPQFIIHIENVGNGQLIGPDTLELKDACVLKNIPKEQLNTVRVSATLFKSRLVCGQTKAKEYEGLVRLEQGKGEITCTIADNELSNPVYSSTQNFMTALTINISYLYKSSTSRTLTIERLLGSETRIPTGNELGKSSGYAYEGNELVRDEDGDPMTECSYYQQRPDKIPQTEVGKVFQTRIKEVAPKNFSCACDYKECDELGRGTNCFVGFCPGDSFCCTAPPDTRMLPNSVGTPGSVSVSGEKFAVSPGVSPKVKRTVENINALGMQSTIRSAARPGASERQILALITIESEGLPLARGDGGKAIGIAQFHPAAAYEMGLCDNAYCSGRDDRKNWQKAIPAAAGYLQKHYDAAKRASKGDVSEEELMKRAAAGYNQGMTCITGSYAGSRCAKANSYVNYYWGYYQEYGQVS